MRPTDHDFDLTTDFCVRCGAARMEVVDRDRECQPLESKVIGVSHIISRRRFGQLLGRPL